MFVNNEQDLTVCKREIQISVRAVSSCYITFAALHIIVILHFLTVTEIFDYIDKLIDMLTTNSLCLE